MRLGRADRLYGSEDTDDWPAAAIWLAVRQWRDCALPTNHKKDAADCVGAVLGADFRIFLIWGNRSEVIPSMAQDLGIAVNYAGVDPHRRE